MKTAVLHPTLLTFEPALRGWPFQLSFLFCIWIYLHIDISMFIVIFFLIFQCRYFLLMSTMETDELVFLYPLSLPPWPHSSMHTSPLVFQIWLHPKVVVYIVELMLLPFTAESCSMLWFHLLFFVNFSFLKKIFLLVITRNSLYLNFFN